MRKKEAGRGGGGVGGVGGVGDVGGGDGERKEGYVPFAGRCKIAPHRSSELNKCIRVKKKARSPTIIGEIGNQ